MQCLSLGIPISPNDEVAFHRDLITVNSFCRCV